MSRPFVRALAGGGDDGGAIGDVASLRARLAAEGAGAGKGAGGRAGVELAALLGLASRSVGWAFAGGIQAALGRLVGAAPSARLAALCATEEGGAHPRAIRAALAPARGGWTLTGSKSFVTMGTDADVLYVVASTGARADGRNQLRVARVDARAPGVSLQPVDPLPFVPEVGHARARFEGVAVGADALLPGDGYEDALKPFRTIEDLHVTAAVVGWSAGVARASSWERSFLERAAAVVTALCALGAEPPGDAETHVALAGALAEAGSLLDGAPWDRTEPAVRAAWERDRALLEVAANVRSARLEAAWSRLASNFRAAAPSNGT